MLPGEAPIPCNLLGFSRPLPGALVFGLRRFLSLVGAAAGQGRAEVRYSGRAQRCFVSSLCLTLYVVFSALPRKHKCVGKRKSDTASPQERFSTKLKLEATTGE